MRRNIERFKSTPYDLLVIGGGINGAAVANMASRNGLTVALIEKKDFGAGTSSKSTKLIHGGLRYLEHFEFGLVRESLRERHLLIKEAPHLVRPITFVIPVYKNDKRPLWMMHAGVFLYDVLSGRYRIGKHRKLTKDEVLKKLPNIDDNNLMGGVLYWDAQMDDARLCLENVLGAASAGADVANYVEATTLQKVNGKVTSVVAKDLLGKQTFEIKAKRVVSAVGPWSNILWKRDNPHGQNRIRTTKGIHLVYEGKIADQAMLLQSQQDRRVFFIIPWGQHTLIGTTDTDYTKHPDDVEAHEQDTRYLLEETKRVFPELDIKKEKIVTTFAGLRPLIHETGAPSKLSRKHVIEESYSKVLYIMGGKYTTYRKVAEDCMKIIMGDKEFVSECPSVGGGVIEEQAKNIAVRFDLDEVVVHHLMHVYGQRYKEVLEISRDDPSLKERIWSHSDDIKAQVAHAVRLEMAQKPEDVLFRRMGLQYVHSDFESTRSTIEQIMEENSSISF